MNKLIVCLIGILFSAVSIAATTIIEWEAPTEYESGEPLSIDDIFGYTIHYGLASRSYSGSIAVSAGTNSYSVELPNGTWYITMTATTVDMETSEYGNEVIRKINGGKPKSPRIR